MAGQDITIEVHVYKRVPKSHLLAMSTLCCAPSYRQQQQPDTFSSQSVAPSPSFVFFMMAVSGASRPGFESPMRSPSDQPIAASILKPMFEPSIFAASCVTERQDRNGSIVIRKRAKTHLADLLALAML